MKYSLDDFAGNYSCLPDVVRQFTSPEAFMVFSEIYSRGCRAYNTTVVHAAISVPRRILQKSVRLGQTRIENAVGELVGLNFISVSCEARKKRLYSINWEEISYVNSIISKLSYEGIEVLHNSCKRNDKIYPVSEIAPSEIKKISETYKFEWDQPGVTLGEGDECNLVKSSSSPVQVQISPDLPQTHSQSGTISVQKSSSSPDEVQISPDCTPIWTRMPCQIVEAEDGNLILDVLLGNTEQILAKRIGFSKIRLIAQSGSKSVQISPDKSSSSPDKANSGLILEFFAPQSGIWTDSQSTVNIYKEEKERKNNKKQEKEEKVNTGIRVENILTTVETERSEVSGKVKVVRDCSNRGMGEEEPGEEENPEMQTFQLGEIEETPDGPLEIIELRDIPADELYEEIKEAARKKTKTVKDNPYRNKPYFSEEVAKRLTSVEGLEEEGYKSPVKLFLFNFWGGLYDEYYLEYIEPNLPVDEYGNQMQGELQNDLDMLEHLIPVEDMARLVAQAWSETADQIECGFVELEDRKVNLEIEEVPDIRFGCLVDWKFAENVNKQPAFIISLKGFRNIEGTDAVEVKVPRTKEEKKAFNRTNRHFLACVTQMEDSQLTPMEQAAKSFAKHYLRMDEYFNVYGFMNGQGLEAHTNNILPGWMMQTWLPTLGELGVDREEFYKILNVPGGYKHGADYQKLNSIFVYDEVRRWNEMKGFQSQINQEKLDAAILSDF